MTFASTEPRRSVISVQDLLCRNAIGTSSTCPSPTANTEPSTAALSSPDISIDRATDIPPSEPYRGSSSDLHPWLSNSTSHFDPKDTVRPLDSPRDACDLKPIPPVLQEPRHKSVRGPWRIEEDRLLIELVNKYGPRHWSAIATHFARRTGKQARERWMNQLNPNLKKKNWAPEEDRVILRAHASLGNKWSAIANLLPGRTDNSVKNRFNSTLKRAMKEQALTPNTFDIDQFVQNLHAKPYIIDPPQYEHLFDGRSDFDQCPDNSARLCYPDKGAEGRPWPLRARSNEELGIHRLPYNPTSGSLSGSDIGYTADITAGRDPLLSHPRTSSLGTHSVGNGYHHNVGTTPQSHTAYDHRRHDCLVGVNNFSVPAPLPPQNSRESSPESFTLTPRGLLVKRDAFTPDLARFGKGELAPVVPSRDDSVSRPDMGGSTYSLAMQRGIEKRYRRSSSF